MRRPLIIAVLSAVVLLPLAAQGQRSMGGFRGSAPMGHASSGFAGRPAVAPRFAPTARFSSPATRMVTPRSSGFISGRGFVPSHNIGLRRFDRFHHRFFHHNRFNNPFFFNSSCFSGFFDPFLCRNPFLASSFVYPYYDPFFSDYLYSTPAPEQQPVVVEQDNNSRELSLQVQELSDEIQAMRDEDRAREEARNNPPPPPATQDQDTILVFRDGHQLKIRNYAITGGTIWVLNEHTAKKYPLSDLDAAATEQANAKNGVDFHLPAPPENH
jgi:hypothetical protein